MLGVLGGADRMVDVVAAGLESGKLVSGHAAGLTGAVLQAYLAAGMTSDHEIFTEPDCLEKLRAGLTVELRGMIDPILPGIVAEVNSLPITPTHLVAATDDLFALTLLGDGGIDHLLRRLVAYGMDPVLALRCATYNAAYRLQRADLGLVAAGRRADIVVLTDLESFTAEHVLTDGQRRRVARPHARRRRGRPERPAATTRCGSRALDPTDMLLRLDVPDGAHRMRVIADAVMTRWDETDVTVRDGVVEIPPGYIVQVTVHRHGRIDPVPHAALLSGWGDWNGAIATTVAHDTHNLVVFGRDADEMALAANTVIASGGGVAVVQGQRGDRAASRSRSRASSRRLPAAEVAAAQRTVQDAAIGIGLFAGSLTQPLFQVMLSSLACLPGPHVTDVGLIDGTTGEVVPTAVIT